MALGARMTVSRKRRKRPRGLEKRDLFFMTSFAVFLSNDRGPPASLRLRTAISNTPLLHLSSRNIFGAIGVGYRYRKNKLAK
jgi:hypothetical protein